MANIRATFDLSGTSHLWRSMMQGSAKRWVEHTKVLAALAQKEANLSLAVMQEACTLVRTSLRFFPVERHLSVQPAVQ